MRDSRNFGTPLTIFEFNLELQRCLIFLD